MVIFFEKNRIVGGCVMETILKIMERNRKYFILEMVTGMGQYTLVSGAFLAGFIHMLGGSDSLNGTMGAIPAIMGFMQVVSSLYMESLKERKKVIVKLVICLRVMLGLIYIVPLLMLPFGISLELFIVLYIAGFGLNALVSPAISEWLVNSTPQRMRGRYFAKRERYAFIVTIVLSYGMSKLLDYYKVLNRESFGFAIIGLTVLVIGVINIIGMSKMEDINHDFTPMKYKFKEAIKMPFKVKGFKKVIVLFIIWGIGMQMGGPFIAVYMISGLKLSYTYVMAISIASTVIRILVAPVWGKIADEKSWFVSAEGSLLIIALTHMGWSFVNASNYRFLIPLLSITGGFAWGGIGISLFSLQYLFAAKKGRTIFIGVNAAISGVVSLAAVRFSGFIIDRLEGHIIVMLGLEFGNIQMAILISSIVLLMMPLYIRLVLRKQVVNVNES